MVEFDPSKPSQAYDAMAPHWQAVRAVLGGVEAMRAAGTRYLPQLPRESREDYAYRLAASPFVNIYADLASALTTKPFANEVGLADGTPPAIADLAEDIDGAGNNLHNFAERLFYSGVNDAIAWVLVDYSRAPTDATIAEEKRLGVRPYWVMIEAPEMLSVKWATIAGRQQVVEARIAEQATVIGADAEERVADRVRILVRDKTDEGYARARWELWEKQEQRTGKSTTWVMIDFGPITIGEIPLVPMIAGRQVGKRLVAVLADVLQLQISHWQRESALNFARTMTAYPMLSASGIEAPADGATIAIGPSMVLYGPPSGDGKVGTWSWIEPAATSLKFLADDIDRLEQQMRELGRQPLTAQSGNITIVAANFAASKANSVAEALSLNLKDALEQALKFTAMWLSIDAEPEVAISTDFDTDTLDVGGTETLLKMREAGDLSLRTTWSELRRRNVLGPNFDPDAEERAILTEMPGDDDFDDIRNAL